MQFPPVFFDPSRAVAKNAGGSLPHWQQESSCVFVTWRTADSLPAERLAVLRQEQNQWKREHPEFFHSSVTASVDAASTLDKELWAEYRELFFGRVQKWLDMGLGDRPLEDRASRRLVEDAIMHFNGVRYVVYAYVVMPNHVHVLFMPLKDVTFAEILHTWKSYTSSLINRRQDRIGCFWQKESWDHLVRNERQFAKLVDYIKMNDPDKAWSAYEE